MPLISSINFNQKKNNKNWRGKNKNKVINNENNNFFLLIIKENAN